MKNFYRANWVHKYFDPNIMGNNPDKMNAKSLFEGKIKELNRIQELRLQTKMNDNERQELNQLTEKYKATNKSINDLIELAKQEAENSKKNLDSTIKSTPYIQDGHQRIEVYKTEDDRLKKDFQYNKKEVTDNVWELAIPPTAIPVTPKNATQNNVDAVMRDFEKTANNVLIARLFGLEENFFSKWSGTIKDKNSLASMLIAVKYAVESGDIPTTKEGWNKIGYSASGIFGYMQKSELNRLVNFAKHIQSDPQTHLRTIDYITGFTSNNREGYIRATEDIYGNRLINMAHGDIKKMEQGADGWLEKRSDTIIAALVGVEDKNYASVDVRDLQAALTRAVNQWNSIEDIYKRITGQQLKMSNQREIIAARLDFRDALEVHLSLMDASGGLNAGLDALLQGKTADYLAQVKKYLENGGEIKLKTRNGEKFTNKQLNIASGIATVIGAVATGWILSMNIRQGTDITTDSILSQLQSDPSIKSKFGNVLGTIGELFLGRKFKLSIGNDDFLKAFEKRILDQASDVLKITYNTNPAKITNPGLRNAFEIAKDNGYIKSESDMQIFHKAIIEHIIESEARGVSDQKAIWASLNPVFFGIHYDRINSKKVATEMSQANLIEGEITKDKMDPARIQGVNISPDNKVFTINSKLPDYTGSSNGEFEVVTIDEKGKFVPIAQNTFEYDTPKNVQLTLVMNQGHGVYILKFTDRPVDDIKPAKVTLLENDTPAMTAEVKKLFEARSDLIEKTRANIGDSIYIMTRNHKYTNFNDAMGKIGDQKYEEALALLSKGRTNTEKKLYQAFKDNAEGLATALTFKYGTVNKDRQGPASANQYAKDHPQGVVNAENRLTTHNKTTAEVESMFKKHPVHTPTELSSLLDGQNLAVSVYATPKGGKHRIDKFSGSITVSNLVLPIKSADAKAEIFDRHKVDNQKNLDSINAYLRSNITMDQFKDWMVNGNLPAGIDSNMVTKHPKFIETRAMIQGNLCANKTEVMAYPLLKMQPKPVVESVDNNAMISIGESTVLADTKVESAHSDVGINPWMIPNKKTTEPQKTSTTPKPERLPDNPIETNPAASAAEQVTSNVKDIINWNSSGTTKLPYISNNINAANGASSSF